jgi:hypothetical protein
MTDAQREGGLDPYRILTDDQWRELHDALAEIARKRRQAGDSLRDWPLP